MRHDRDRSQAPEYRLLRARRPEAVQSWFLRYADPLYTFVFYRVARERDIAADVVHETFLKALEKIDQFDAERGTMLSWLKYTARNCIRTALRQRARYRAHLALWDAVDRRLADAYRRLADAPLPEEILQQKETAELVHMTMAQLPENYRLVLKEHYWSDRSVKDIASAHGMTPSGVKSLLHRARLAFKNTLLTLTESFSGPPAAEGGIP